MTLRTYDIKTDEWRDVTQYDLDKAERGVQALGLLLTFLKTSDRMRDGMAAEIAIEAAQGRTSIKDGAAQFRSLLDHG
jgi:hypothetical protein